MTWARIRRTWDEVRPSVPSRFISDIPEDCLAMRARSAPRRPDLGRRPAPPAAEEIDQRAPDGDEPVYYLDEEGDDDPVFPRGALVRHKIFGVGQIEEGSGRGPDRKLTVRFPGRGLKTIVARFVEKI
jgi:DNA helicase-2/ATP-dependent DNA helicase PcrA